MSERRLAIARIPGDFDLCDLLRGHVHATNLPPDAVTRRIHFDINVDAWLVQVYSSTFDPVREGAVLPMFDLCLTRLPSSAPPEKP